jgi:hypothetical protein
MRAALLIALNELSMGQESGRFTDFKQSKKEQAGMSASGSLFAAQANSN